MLLTIVNIVYVLVAVAMIVMILLQRGAGAAAGSGFGGGASATVFGARGSANFLSKSTAILATMFFVISLGMAMVASRGAQVAPSAEDLGVMGALQAPTEVPAAPSEDSAVTSPAAQSAAEVPAAAADAAPAVDAPAVEADAAAKPETDDK